MFQAPLKSCKSTDRSFRTVTLLLLLLACSVEHHCDSGAQSTRVRPASAEAPTERCCTILKLNSCWESTVQPETIRQETHPRHYAYAKQTHSLLEETYSGQNESDTQG